MRLELLTALAVAGAIAPPASAGHAAVNCKFVAVSYPLVTGQDTWEGIADGYLVANPGENASLRCVIKVNGAVRAATARSSGISTVTTGDRVTYVRTSTESVQVCAQYTTGHGSAESCRTAETVQAPPPEVVDFGNAVSEAADVFACAMAARLAGAYGPAEIKPDGDTYVNGTLVWDCAPYARDPWPRGGISPVYVAYG